MTNALDKGYNEGRLAFRRYFAKYGPNVKHNDPRMPPNPYVGYYGVLWLNGFESELRRHVAFAPRRADSARGGPDFAERAEKQLSSFCGLQGSRTTAVSRSAKGECAGEGRKPPATLPSIFGQNAPPQPQVARRIAGLARRQEWADSCHSHFGCATMAYRPNPDLQLSCSAGGSLSLRPPNQTVGEPAQ